MMELQSTKPEFNKSEVFLKLRAMTVNADAIAYGSTQPTNPS